MVRGRRVEVDALQRRAPVRKMALHDLSEMVERSNLFVVNENEIRNFFRQPPQQPQRKSDVDVGGGALGQDDGQRVEVEAERVQLWLERLRVGHIAANKAEVSGVELVAWKLFERVVFSEERSKDSIFGDFRTFCVRHHRKIDFEVAAFVSGNNAAIF